MHMAAQPRRDSQGNHLDNTTQCVALSVSEANFLLHRKAGCRIQAAHGVGIDALSIISGGYLAIGEGDRADTHNMAQNQDPSRLLQECPSDGTESYPGCCLTGTGTLQYRAGIFKSVLLHAHQICMPGTWSS